MVDNLSAYRHTLLQLYVCSVVCCIVCKYLSDFNFRSRDSNGHSAYNFIAIQFDSRTAIMFKFYSG